MLSNIKKYSYDALSLTAVLGYVLVQLSAPILSPIYAAPIVLYSASKTAYHALIFFHSLKFPDQYASEILQENYKDKNHQYKKADIKGLEIKLQAFEHQKKRDEYWSYTCKAAKGLIPIIGYIWLLYGKSAKTSLKPEDTWSDINALKFHIRLLKPANS